MSACPVCTHANTQISSTLTYKSAHYLRIVFEQGIITVSITKPTGHCNHVYSVKEHIFDFVSTEQFEVVVVAQGLHDSIATLYRTFRIMNE
jgi:phosphoketolase